MKKIIIFFLVLCNIVAYSTVSYYSSPYLEISFFDIGQGDCILIETGNKHQILIDGGPNLRSAIEDLPKEIPFWDRNLDLVVLTHPDNDHLTGLIEVLRTYNVENILTTKAVAESERFKEWQGLMKQEKANVFLAEDSKRIIADDIVLDVLSPRDIGNLSSNDASIVLKLNYEKNSFLFTGDITTKVEQDFDEKTVDSDVLKVAHHGSKYSSSPDFINKVSPSVAVIQVGKNNYGHPAEEVLTQFSKSGIKLLRNDENGDIKLVSDGEIIKIIRDK